MTEKYFHEEDKRALFKPRRGGIFIGCKIDVGLEPRRGDTKTLINHSNQKEISHRIQSQIFSKNQCTLP